MPHLAMLGGAGLSVFPPPRLRKLLLATNGRGVFVEVARSKGLSIIAVTDHHDTAMAEYVIAAAAQYDDFLVLAGVEITCRDGVQVLLCSVRADDAIS